MATLNSIKTKAIQGNLKGALDALLDWVKTNKPASIALVESYLSNINHYIRENAAGKITSEQFSAANAKISEGFFLLISELSGSTRSGVSRFQTYHSFTCNRSDQMKMFDSVYKDQLLQKSQFYYIYGLDLQSHKGMFKRIAYHLEDLLSDYLDPLFEKQKSALRVVVPSIDLDKDSTIYKENVLKKLFRSFSIDANAQSELVEKQLSFILENSPQVKGLGANDFVCVFMGITDRDWDQDYTPDLVRWFINEFCECSLPENSPNFLFFFGIIYEEEDSNVKQEVGNLLKDSELIKALPELSMVSESHLKDWFDEYIKFFPKVRNRKNIIIDCLENLEEYKEANAFYMEDIQDELQRIIDKVNEDLVSKKQ